MNGNLLRILAVILGVFAVAAGPHAALALVHGACVVFFALAVSAAGVMAVLTVRRILADLSPVEVQS